MALQFIATAHHEKEAESSSVMRITIPPLPCSFTWKNFPDALQIEEMSDQWVTDRCKDMPSACKGPRAASFFAAEYLIDSAFHLGATLGFANAASARLLIPIMKLFNWYFLLDNIVDDPSEMGSDPAAASYLIDAIVAVFECRQAGEKELNMQSGGLSSDNEYVERWVSLLADTAAEWWEEMRMDMSPGLQARFRETFVEYLHSNTVQMPFRISRHFPDLETYLHFRRRTAGYYPIAVLTEYSLGVDLDAQALSHPLMQTLITILVDHVVFVNDVTSFPKEYLQGDVLNVVFVLCYNKKKQNAGAEEVQERWVEELGEAEVQEAVEETCRMIKELDEACVRVMEEIRRCEELMQKEGMAACLEGFAYWLAGNLYWNLTARRYGLDNSGIKSTQIRPSEDILVAHHIHLPPFTEHYT